MDLYKIMNNIMSIDPHSLPTQIKELESNERKNWQGKGGKSRLCDVCS